MHNHGNKTSEKVKMSVMIFTEIMKIEKIQMEDHKVRMPR